MPTLFRYSFGLALTLGVAAGCGDDASGTDAAAGSAGRAGANAAGTSSAGSGHGGSGGQAAGGSHAGSGVSGGGAAAAGSSGKGGGAPEGGAAGTTGGSGDGGAAPGNGVIEDCLDTAVIGGTRTEALSFVGEGVAVGIVRRVDPDGVGTSGTTIWLPQRFALVRGAVAECVSAMGSLSYMITHHNFDDSMSATSGGETWTLTHAQLDYDKPEMWSIEGKQGQNVVWGPVALTLSSCLRLDNQQDCTDANQ